MKHRSTLVYAALLLLLAGFYFYDNRNREKQKEAEEKTARVFEFRAEQLQSITLSRGDEIIRMEKSGAGAAPETWEIAAPFRAPVDAVVLTRLQATAAELKSVRLIAAETRDPSSYGLDRPVFKIAFQAAGKTETLCFGAQNPLENAYYARKNNESPVILIDRFDKEDLDQALFTLRDKRLFTIPAEKATRLVLTRGSETWAMVKKEGQWSLAENPSFKFNHEKLEALIRRSARQEALSFEIEETRDMRPYGLDKPQAGLLLADENKSEQLLIGKPFPDQAQGKTYVRIKGMPRVMTVSAAFVSVLLDFTEELQEKP